MAKLDKLTCCNEQHLDEYYHEHDECSDPECYAEECLSCGAWHTLCGMTS